MIMAFRVVSVMVATGECVWCPPFNEVGVSGPGPKFTVWFMLCVVIPGIIEGLKELMEEGGVEK